MREAILTGSFAAIEALVNQCKNAEARRQRIRQCVELFDRPPFGD